MKKPYLNIFLSILILAALLAAIVSAGDYPAHEQNNQPDKNAASMRLTSADHHGGNSCRVCHDYGGDRHDLRSKQNNQQDMSAASVSLASIEYHHVDSCVVCHDMSGDSPNLHLVFEVINTPNSGLKDVIFTAYEGTNSYADGDTTYNGVCEVCHTETRHHQNDGNNPDPDSHYANTSCRECHAHEDEFSHGGGSGSGCEDCHGHDPGYEYEPGKFSEGAGTVQSHSTHTENDSDDLKGPNIACGDCHDIENYPYFKSGTGNPPYDLSGTDACDNCHSAGGSINGINDATVGAKENWNNGIYETEGATLKSGKDKWCAGCHDDEPANSQFDGTGVPAPNIAGRFISVDDGAWTSPVDIVAENTTMLNADILIDGNINTGISAGPGGTTVVFDLGGSVDVTHIRLYTANNSGNRGPTVRWGVYGSNDLVNWTPILLGDGVIFARPAWLTGGEAGWNESRLDMFIPVQYIKLEKRSPWPTGATTQLEFEYKADLQYGYYETGHKIECDNCHNIGSAHFDGISQTYNASLNNYQAGYRLRNVEVGEETVSPMEIPRVGNNWGEYPKTSNDFALCFDCHDKYNLLGDAYGTDDFFKDPLQTNFRNENHVDANGNVTNEHLRHLKGRGHMGNAMDWDSDWNGIGDSPQSCTACHNVHGSPTLAMTRHGELVSTPGTMDKVPLFNVRHINTNGTLDYELSNVLETIGAQTQFYAPGPGTQGKNNMCNMCHNDLIIYYRTPVSKLQYHDDDWREEWMGEGTPEGSDITTGEVQDAIHHWLEELPVRGYTLSTMDLQEVISLWLSEEQNPR